MRVKHLAVAALVIFTGLLFAASIDSLTWTRLYSDSHSSDSAPGGGIETTWITGLAQGSSRFVATMANGNALVSTDGSTWTPHDITPDAGSSLLYGAGKFVFFVESFDSNDEVQGLKPYSSPDGITWTQGHDGGNQPYAFPQYSGEKYGAGRFLILNDDRGASSTDGALWSEFPLIDSSLTVHAPEGDPLDIYPLAATPSRFVGLRQDYSDEEPGYRILTSLDGQTWTPATEAASGKLKLAQVTYPEEEEGPLVVDSAGFTNVVGMTASPNGQLIAVIGVYTEAGTFDFPYTNEDLAIAVSSNGGVSWTVVEAKNTVFGSTFPLYDKNGDPSYQQWNALLLYWNGRLVLTRTYDKDSPLMPFFTSTDGLNWQAATGLNIADRSNPPKASSYIDSMLIMPSQLLAATSYYPKTAISGNSDDVEFVTISSATLSTIPPPPAQDPAKQQIEAQVKKLKKQLKAAKKIADPVKRAKKISQIKKKIKRLKKKLK